MGKKKIWKNMVNIGCFCALFFVACGRQEENEEGVAITPTNAVSSPAVPTKATEVTPTNMPANTPTNMLTITPGITLYPDFSDPSPDDPKNKAEEDSLSAPTFPTVAPLAADQVLPIANTMTREEFPSIDGSTATIPLSEAVYCLATGEDAEAAKKAIHHTKTTNSYSRLYSGEADLLIVYEPADSIIKRMQEEPLLIKPIGLDALVFMANAKNPVESLSGQQLVDIYSGGISNWIEVGGKDQELLAFQRPKGSGSQTLMQKLVMGDAAMAEGDNVYRYGTMAEILEGMLNYTGDDNTLGYSVYYYASQMYHLPDLKFMGVDGVIPSAQTIYDGSYPYTNAFYAVIRPDEPADSNAHRIFDWLTGKEGQSMVLNLGYVPVIMPEGAKISEGGVSAGGAEEFDILNREALSQKKLEEGQHFIFFQKQNVSWEYDYGKVTIYDHNWEKCATFYNAETYANGVFDGRYLSIGQYRKSPDGKEGFENRIYDLKEGCFLSDKWFEDAWLLDPVRGYFYKYPTDEERRAYYLEQEGNVDEWGRIYNVKGELLLDHMPMYEGGMLLHKEGDIYRYWWKTARRSEEGQWESFDLQMFYDLDLRLKLGIYGDERILPKKEEREPQAVYALEEECLFSADGEILLSPEKFLERFGDGEDKECSIINYGGEIDKFNHPAETKLYEFHYKDKSYYVDRTLQFCWIEGEEKGECLADKKKNLPYYFVANNIGGEKKTRYFKADGNPLLMKDGTAPDQVLCYGDGYALVRLTKEAVTVEEYLPKEDFFETYTYPAPRNLEDEFAYTLYYLGTHCFAAQDSYLDEVYRQELRFFFGNSETDFFLARSISFWEEYCSNHDRNETPYFMIDNDESITVETEGDEYEEKDFVTGEQYLRQYLLFKDGKVNLVTEPGELSFVADGYLQIRVGNYDIVYDMDGNILIRAMNRVLEND